MTNIVLDAGTTWSKIVERTTSSLMANYTDYFIKSENGLTLSVFYEQKTNTAVGSCIRKDMQ